MAMITLAAELPPSRPPATRIVATPISRAMIAAVQIRGPSRGHGFSIPGLPAGLAQTAAVLRITIVSPADLTSEVLGVLDAEVGTSVVSVVRGAAQRPPGDLVSAEVARESVDPVVDRLVALGVRTRGSISVSDLDLVLSDAADEAERRAPGLGDDAVVWRSVEHRTGQDTQVSIVYVALMAVATMIAGVGVLLDEPILIVGAMVVGPDFGPLAALSVAIVRRRPRIIGTSLLALVVGYSAGIVATTASTFALGALGLARREMITASSRSLAFIWTPDALSWIVGFLAGIAGIISLTSTRSGGLVGVAISVTTIPAAANAAAAIAFGVNDEFAGSLLQLAINLVAIVVGGVLTLVVQRAWRRLHTVRARRRAT